MRHALVVLCLLVGSLTSAVAQVSIGIGLPSVSIGINIPTYPALVRVPGYPVYYAPRLDSNFFFYDGMYWVYSGDNWYAGYWYNGPWALVAPEVVPLFVLRVPVRYYRVQPAYFRGWRADAPPRWGEHWGPAWAQRRGGWDRWNRQSVPAAAPLPAYQRQYAGNRYPQVEQQRVMVSKSYRYKPREVVVRQHFQEHVAQKAAARAEPKQQAAPQERRTRQQEVQRSSPPAAAQKDSPAPRAQQRGGDDAQKSAPPKAAPPQRERERGDQDKGRQGKGAASEPRREKGEEKGRERGEEKGREKGEERGGDRKK